MATTRSRVLIIGATGNFGRHLINASIAAGHPTFFIIRDSTTFSQPQKFQLVETFISAGAKAIKGSLEDESSLVEAIKQVDVVICAVSGKQALEQKHLIKAIKEAGNIKRFIPSEFGSDPEKVHIPDNVSSFYPQKAEIRRIIKEEGIPYTCISCNFFTGVLLPSLVQPGLKSPPTDKVTIFGDGNTKAVFMKEGDVAAFTINAVDDPRSLNKVLYLRPPGNAYSLNELVELWETKIGKKLEKAYVPEEEVLKSIREIPYPSNLEMSYIYSAFVKGDHTYFDIEPTGVDGTQLYPHLQYTTISEYLDTLL